MRAFGRVGQLGAVAPKLLNDASGFGAYGVMFVIDALVGWAAQGIHSTPVRRKAHGMRAHGNEVFLREFGGSECSWLQSSLNNRPSEVDLDERDPVGTCQA